MADRANQLEETGGNLRFLQALLEESKIGLGSRVLEIGCGTGLLASYVIACTGATVTGTERCADMARIAGRRIRCLYLPDGRLPDLTDEQDLIICKDVLPMIANKASFLTGIRRMLRPAGAFLVYLPEEEDYKDKPLYRFLPAARRQSQERYGTISDFIHDVYESGFDSVRTRRLFLGTIGVNCDYVKKHWDGFFSNTEGQAFEAMRREGLERIRRGIELCDDEGILLHYEWERTLVIAR